MNLIKSLYIIAIGLLVAAFVGFGVDSFYSQPKEPQYPTDLQYKSNGELSAKDQQKMKEFDKAQRDFQDKMNTYNRNVSVIIIAFAVLILAASIIGLSKIDIIGDGTTLGGVFLLFYGIIRAFASQESQFRFIAITVALIIIVGLTYWKFLRGKINLAASK